MPILLVRPSLLIVGLSLGRPPYFGCGFASPIGITTKLAPMVADGWNGDFFGKNAVRKFGGFSH
jgi:hypothetical protein